ncbi:hypothetical protein CGRA01v4_04633 [Colletotrichum graminicola]|nr:hypothetical protein CGRA01v4_04633 [Colletotrichum graminicola]
MRKQTCILGESQIAHLPIYLQASMHRVRLRSPPLISTNTRASP